MFNKDEFLDPVDPHAGNEVSPLVVQDMPDPPTESELEVELEEVRKMVTLRDVPLDETGKEFRLPILGCEDGPYLSTLLTDSFVAGKYMQDNKIMPVMGEYLTTSKAYNDMRKGKTVKIKHDKPKVMETGRDLGSAVHNDWPNQFYTRAMLQLYGQKIPLSYVATGRKQFVQDGIEHLCSLMADLHRKTMQNAWVHKWDFRVLRPEELAAKQGDYLPLLFPEGAPVHPSYPAGHAACAGAMITILKCWFENVEFGNSTVHEELNKLGANVAHGRSWAGVHYRADNLEGLYMGEGCAKRFIDHHLPKRNFQMLPIGYDRF